MRKKRLYSEDDLNFHKPNQVQKKYLSLLEAAEYLGISPSTLYKLNSRRKISYHKPSGKKIYYLIDDLDAWLSQNRQESTEEAVQNYIYSRKNQMK
jgi:excisionase family DNA binding protein